MQSPPHQRALQLDPQSLSQWILGRLPECAIFTVGVLLRLTMTWRFDATWGYDALAHWAYVEQILRHASLPHCADNHLAFHPPLYHAVAAGLAKLGASHQDVTWLSVGCGVIRLGLIWFGLERYLQRRSARIFALALAAVLPASVHIDGTVSNEVMNGTLAAVAMLLWVRAFRAIGRSRWYLACTLGLALGLGMLSKASEVILLAAFGAGLLLDLLLPLKSVDWQTRLRSLTPWAATLAICVAIAGWFYMRNVAQGHNLFDTSYEIAPDRMRHTAANTPYLHRRPVNFVAGWDWSIYWWPYWPSGTDPRARFFPVALASTFVDYYNHGFSGLHPDQQSALMANGRPMTARLVWLSRGAVFGGSVILLATLAAWAVCLLRTFQRRDWGLFPLLLIPLLATIVALAFAVRYPYDAHGVVKGVYIQFGAPPLYAMFGVSVGWAASSRRRWVILAILLLGLGAVAAYTFCCRTGLLL
jgi:4-amino-4-deoxy-L-arabinose transferase-like glycosyltransferase